MTAIEERDGVRYYVERTSPLKPIQLLRTPGFKANMWKFEDAEAGAGARAARETRVPASVDVLVVALPTTAGWRGRRPGAGERDRAGRRERRGRRRRAGARGAHVHG